jgi:hypothetical protein
MKDDQNNHREFGRKVLQQFLDVLQTPAPRAAECNYEIVWVDADEPRCRDGLAPLASPPSFDVAHHIEGISQSHGGSPLLRRERYRSLNRRLAEADAGGDRRIRAAARNNQLSVEILAHRNVAPHAATRERSTQAKPQKNAGYVTQADSFPCSSQHHFASEPGPVERRYMSGLRKLLPIVAGPPQVAFGSWSCGNARTWGMSAVRRRQSGP